MEALGGTCWWQGDLPAMTPRYREALEIWQTLDDEAELANAYYNASFTYAVNVGFGPADDADDDQTGLLYLEQARDIFRRIGDRRGEGNAVWGLGNYLYFRRAPGNGEEQFRETLTIFGEVGDRTMEAWALHMLGTSLLRNGHVDEARGHIAHAIRHFHAAGDASGLTLTFDDMSAVAVADGDLPRAARLRGAARNLTVETGAQLAGYVEDTFETGVAARRPDPDVVGGSRPVRRGGRGLDAGRGDGVRPRRHRTDRFRRSPRGVGLAPMTAEPFRLDVRADRAGR